MKRALLLLCVAGFTMPAFAGMLQAASYIDYQGDEGVVFGETALTFFPWNPEEIYVSGRMSRNYAETLEEIEGYDYGDAVDRTEGVIRGSWRFQPEPAGGCYVGKDVGTDDIDVVTGYSDPVCWDPTQCHLSVTIDSDGWTSTGEATGYYGCYECIGLTASPYPGWEFEGWTGDVFSHDASVTICMNGSDRFVTASFSEISSPPGGGGDTETPPGDPTDHNGGVSPIVINLAQGAWELSGLDYPVRFDLDADGVPDLIGWSAAGSQVAFLALDRNGNGRIDDGAELFGNYTRLKSGALAANGFEALRELDANGDGKIDAADPVWQSLLLWVDSNHNGICNIGELQHVSRTSLTSISLNYHFTGRRDQHGNFFRYEALVSFGHEHRPIYDVFFVTR